MQNNEYLYRFLDAHPLCVISTTNVAGAPEAAVVGFGQTKNLELIIGTNNTTRKYRNLISNPQVACVIGWEGGETVQYEGRARELTPAELAIVRDAYWVKNPYAETQGKQPEHRYFLITPTWIRHTDIKTKPWTTQEVHF